MSNPRRPAVKVEVEAASIPRPQLRYTPLVGTDDLPPDGWGWWMHGGWEGEPLHPVPVFKCECGALVLVGVNHVVQSVGGCGVIYPASRQPSANENPASCGPTVICRACSRHAHPALLRFAKGDPGKHRAYLKHIQRQEAP